MPSAKPFRLMTSYKESGPSTSLFPVLLTSKNLCRPDASVKIASLRNGRDLSGSVWRSPYYIIYIIGLEKEDTKRGAGVLLKLSKQNARRYERILAEFGARAACALTAVVLPCLFKIHSPTFPVVLSILPVYVIPSGVDRVVAVKNVAFVVHLCRGCLFPPSALHGFISAVVMEIGGVDLIRTPDMLTSRFIADLGVPTPLNGATACIPLNIRFASSALFAILRISPSILIEAACITKWPL